MGCRRRAEVQELVRVVRRADGSLSVGRSLPGRGAWLCKGSADCLARAVRARAFERALRGAIAPGAPDGLARELGLGPDVRGWMNTPASREGA